MTGQMDHRGGSGLNLQHLFEIQGGLDAHINKQKGLEGQDLLPKKLLALQVELGECANEWRGFKFWSEDQNPRTKSYSHQDEGHIHGGFYSVPVYDKNPLLEEYVDCLHFTISIGLDLGMEPVMFVEYLEINDNMMNGMEDKFLYVSKKVLDLYENIRDKKSAFPGVDWLHLLQHFLGLGRLLGFTDEQIEAAYLNKNEENHRRQQNGY